jgi:hypothetical protein
MLTLRTCPRWTGRTLQQIRSDGAALRASSATLYFGPPAIVSAPAAILGESGVYGSFAASSELFFLDDLSLPSRKFPFPNVKQEIEIEERTDMPSLHTTRVRYRGSLHGTYATTIPER